MTESSIVENQKNQNEKNEKVLSVKFQAAYTELMQYSLGWIGPKQYPVISGLSAEIGRNEITTAALVILYKNASQKNHHDVKEIAFLLSQLIHVSSTEARREIRKLITEGMVEHEQLKEDKFIQLVPETLEAIDQNDLAFFLQSESKGIEFIMEQLNLNLFEPYQISPYKLDDFYEQIADKNQDLNLIKYVDEHLFVYQPVELFTLLGTLTYSFLLGKPYDFEKTEDKLRGNLLAKTALKIVIQNSEWEPIKEGYFNVDGGGLKDNNPKLTLSDKGFEYFFGDIKPEILEIIRTKNIHFQLPLLEAKEIKEIPMFFTPSLQNELQTIEQLLSNGRFESYKNENKFKNTGITALFYGDPGCGKTEFALQLARKTGRNIVKVQITDVLSKWVGESESNLKRIFDDYRKACRKFEKTPILFFNEADQLISKRMEAHNGVDQMHNGMQNILLEEMEMFDGILIGTTNLETQMDAAFERRWLLKVNFGVPGIEAQEAIWQSFIPELPQLWIQKIVHQYSLTPGEIANLVKRLNIEVMLGLTVEEYGPKLWELCKTERFQKKGVEILGFHPTTALKHLS